MGLLELLEVLVLERQILLLLWSENFIQFHFED